MAPMRLPRTPATRAGMQDLPPWPPLLATRGPGARSGTHVHHAMHLVLAVTGALRVRTEPQGWRAAAGVLTAPDVAHAIDATGTEVVLVFLDPESEVGAALASALSGPVRLIDPAERAALVQDADPRAILGGDGVAWTGRALQVLQPGSRSPRRPVHPAVRKLLRLLRTASVDSLDSSLPGLARAVGLSPGRLMHAFTSSIGIPLRPYLGWLRLQRAAGAIVADQPLADAAQAAGFADAAHLTRTFRRMFGVPPSSLRPARLSGS
jgi:AraC-like DNA-binding protein